MRYQFLEIRSVNGVEVAYLLDTKTGKVIKSLVDDYTGGMVEEDTTDVFRKPLVKTPMKRRLIVESDEGDEAEIPADRPRVAPKAVIPPALRGIFLPPDTPGAAVETRVA